MQELDVYQFGSLEVYSRYPDPQDLYTRKRSVTGVGTQTHGFAICGQHRHHSLYENVEYHSASKQGRQLTGCTAGRS